jgi:hypothetical protein
MGEAGGGARSTSAEQPVQAQGIEQEPHEAPERLKNSSDFFPRREAGAFPAEHFEGGAFPAVLCEDEPEGKRTTFVRAERFHVRSWEGGGARSIRAGRPGGISS